MSRIRITRDRRGRPDQYEPDYARMAQAHCKLGATDAELADLFNVGTATIHNWIARHKDFAEAIRAGMLEVFSPRVVRALGQRAIGYAIDVEEVKVMKDGDLVRYTVRKHYPPDVTACIFWLKNRDPKNWRDVQEHNHQNLDKLSSRELLAEIRREAAELGIDLSARGVAAVIADSGQSRH